DSDNLTRIDLHGVWKSLAAPETYQVPWVLAAPVWHEPPPKSEYGLEVYDGNGRITFSSDADYLLIRSVQTATIGTAINHPAVQKDRYIAINSTVGWRWYNQSFGVVDIGGVRNLSSTSVLLDWNTYWSGNPFYNSGSVINPVTVMVCDVPPT
ncbi:MAG: hypothetical protein ACRCWC_04460, partial [Plesiomonas shigelloides]